MPPLVAFGRKWEIGSDDLVYPGIRNVFLRTPWLIGTSAIYWRNSLKSDCSKMEYLDAFLLGSVGILVLMILADLFLIYNSSRGGIMDTKARRHVPLCLYIKVTLFIAELGWNILGTYAYAQKLFGCDEASATSTWILGLIIFNWLMLAFFCIYWIRQYDPLGKSLTHPNLNDEDEIPITARSSQWERRCRFLGCCAWNEAHSEEIQDSYTEIGRYFSYVFSKSDLVASDIIAGLVLQSLKTKSKREKAWFSNEYHLKSSVNYNSATNKLNLPVSQDWDSIPSALHFLKYAIAIFTIPAAYHYRGPGASGFLCKNLQCFNFVPGRKKYPVEVANDNCCFSKTAAIRSIIDDEDIVYASYDNANFCSPFLVAMDHSTKSIVIVIRGSFSTVDFLVDLNALPAPINVEGLPTGFKAHRGILNVTKSIKERLDNLRILSRLLGTHPEYKIMVTGISLGAGVAAILSAILRQEFPNVKCLAFSVPGGLVSLDMAEYCNDFVTSIVYGDDLVPRLGVASFQKCLGEIESILYATKTPKYKIQMGIGCSILGIRNMRKDFIDEESSSTSNNVPKIQNPELRNNALFKREERSSLEQFRLYPPGMMLHVTQTPLFEKARGKKWSSGLSGGPRWEVRWADRMEFNEIVLSERMALDHLPLRLIKAFKFFTKLN